MYTCLGLPTLATNCQFYPKTAANPSAKDDDNAQLLSHLVVGFDEADDSDDFHLGNVVLSQNNYTVRACTGLHAREVSHIYIYIYIYTIYIYIYICTHYTMYIILLI